jgi:hypothetical protein
VDAADKTGPSSAFGRKASDTHRNVPSKADIRGSIPLAFCTGVSLVRVVQATKVTNMTFAMLAATNNSLWMLSTGR